MAWVNLISTQVGARVLRADEEPRVEAPQLRVQLPARPRQGGDASRREAVVRVPDDVPRPPRRQNNPEVKPAASVAAANQGRSGSQVAGAVPHG